MTIFMAPVALVSLFTALVGLSVAEMDDEGRMFFLRANPGSRPAHRMLASSSGDDGMPTSTATPVVGIGFYPLTAAADVRSSTSDQELVQDLEKDSRVTVHNVQLGELMCDSLPNAEDAPALAFPISPNETITANKKFYTVHDGTTFADCISRKVWTGEVADDNDAVFRSRTVSMTWGDVCDTETFNLEIIAKCVNGTVLVSKTIPCEDSLDICFVQLELDLPQDGGPDGSEADLNLSGNVRRLRGSPANSVVQETRHETDVRSIKSTGRKLQSTTQIDLMFMYTPSGRDLLGVSDSQMQSELADSLDAVNDAMVNSAIDVQFSLVRVEPLPYIENSSESLVILDNLKASSEVAASRDLYGADLVQLVAELEDYCGIGDLPTPPSDADAFSVVDPLCFYQFTHTHELGHNMGCYHDRENSFTQHSYAHGYRYCSGDLPYRTIMAYSCFDDNGNTVIREPYFSNPNVTHNDKPTGTTRDDCARRITETMGSIGNYREPGLAAATPAPSTDRTLVSTIGQTMAPITALTPSPTTAQTSAPSTTARAKCTNGIADVTSGRYCCALECGSCGGSDCHERAAEADLTPEDCCVSLIRESGVYCDDSGAAPCISGEG
ncbi:unnamed protein product [Ascophyllum nodosum]